MNHLIAAGLAGALMLAGCADDPNPLDELQPPSARTTYVMEACDLADTVGYRTAVQRITNDDLFEAAVRRGCPHLWRK